jgi:hypothetical protein
LLQLTGRLERVAQAAVGDRRQRIQLQRRLEAGNGARQIAGRPQRQAPLVMHGRAVALA